jgi:hypothetical protein
VLDHHQTEGAVKHPEGKSPLDAGDLILVEFHRVDFSATVLVIAGKGPENTGEQDAGAAAEGMDWLI